MRWNRATLMAFAAVIPSAGCVSVGRDFTAPTVDAPAVFAGAPEHGQRTEAAWWRAFAAPALDSIIAEALAASPTAAEADAALEAARARRDAANGGRFPWIDATTGAERTRINAAAFGFDGFPTRELSRYTAGLGVSYDLDLFGGHRRGREAATANLEAERFRRDAARLTLALDVTAAAIEVAALREELNVVEAIVDDDRRTLDLAERALRAGAVADIDRIRAQTQLAQDSAELPRLRARLAAAQNELSILAGRTPGLGAPLLFSLEDFAFAPAPGSVPSELLRGRPDIRAAEAALHAATAEIGVHLANLYPQIRLSGNYTQTSLDPETLFQYSAAGWGAGPGLSIPIFRGGALRAEVRRAEADARRADARYRATVLRAFGQVIDAYATLAASETEQAMRGESAVLAAENLRLSRRAYEVGAGTLPEVLDAQRQFNLARRAQVRATAARLASAARLYGALATPSAHAAGAQADRGA